MKTHYRPVTGGTWTVDVFMPQPGRWTVGLSLEIETHRYEQLGVLTVGVVDVHVHRIRRRSKR